MFSLIIASFAFTHFAVIMKYYIFSISSMSIAWHIKHWRKKLPKSCMGMKTLGYVIHMNLYLSVCLHLCLYLHLFKVYLCTEIATDCNISVTSSNALQCIGGSCNALIHTSIHYLHPKIHSSISILIPISWFSTTSAISTIRSIPASWPVPHIFCNPSC